MGEQERLQFNADKLRREFERELPKMAARRLHSNEQQFIPLGFFAVASSECRDLYIAGHFYGCISLCQSVAEGLTLYIAECSGMKNSAKDYEDRIKTLERRHFITPPIATAFRNMHGNDRNDFHHLNKKVEQDYRKLEARAAECLNLLHQIESDLFTVEITEGGIRPKHRKYWPKHDEETFRVFIREV